MYTKQTFSIAFFLSTPIGADSLSPRETSASTFGLASLNEEQCLGRAVAWNSQCRADLAGWDRATDTGAVGRTRRLRDDRTRRAGRRAHRRQRDETGYNARLRCARRPWRGSRGLSSRRRALDGGRAELDSAPLIRARSRTRRHERCCWDRCRATARLLEGCREVAVAEWTFLITRPALDRSRRCWAVVLGLGQDDARKREEG